MSADLRPLIWFCRFVSSFALFLDSVTKFEFNWAIELPKFWSSNILLFTSVVILVSNALSLEIRSAFSFDSLVLSSPSASSLASASAIIALFNSVSALCLAVASFVIAVLRSISTFSLAISSAAKFSTIASIPVTLRPFGDTLI